MNHIYFQNVSKSLSWYFITVHHELHLRIIDMCIMDAPNLQLWVDLQKLLYSLPYYPPYGPYQGTCDVLSSSCVHDQLHRQQSKLGDIQFTLGSFLIHIYLITSHHEFHIGMVEMYFVDGHHTRTCVFDSSKGRYFLLTSGEKLCCVIWNKRKHS